MESPTGTSRIAFPTRVWERLMTDEHVDLDDLAKATEIVARALAELMGGDR